MKARLVEWLRLPGASGPRKRLLLGAYFLFGLVLVGVAAILFAGRTARQVERQAALLTRVFSQFVSETVFEVERPGAFRLIEDILREADFPIILTAADGTPLVWHGVDVLPTQADSPDDLGGENLTPQQRRDRARLDALVRDFDARNPPYPIEVRGAVQAYVHFGQSGLSRQLRWIPMFLVGVVAVFVAVGLVGFQAMKQSEQRSIWVGMARETAHQLGTPLTSLLGWVQLLRGGDERRDGESAEEALRRRHTTYDEMEQDLGRLSKVTARFSKIGAMPELLPLDVGEVVEETVRYIRRRAPHLGAQVHIHASLPPLPRVLANRELLEWVLENLLKNALDALENGGQIRVQARAQDLSVELRVSDSGRGIPPRVRKSIWEPGYTTKERGWGLGLTLVRRIVEEYHGGRIWVEDNPDRRGVCFALRLPAAN